MKRGTSARRRFQGQIAIVVALAILVTGSLVGVYLWESAHESYDDPGNLYALPSLEYQGETYLINPRVQTTLIIGLDTFEDGTNRPESYNNNQQADFLLLLVFDEDTKTSRALHINRDTMAEMNVLGVTGQPLYTTVRQIALSHTYGSGNADSCRNVASAVSRLLGDIRIDHYLSVTMDGVQVLNDAVGGVTVEVIGDLTSVDPALREGETVTLRGDQALTYVRSRYGVQDGTNLSRMERQRQYLTELYSSMMRAVEADDSFSMNVADDLWRYVVTDYSVNQLESLFETFGEYEYKGIRSIQGEAVKGESYIEFMPDEEDLLLARIELFYQLRT